MSAAHGGILAPRFSNAQLVTELRSRLVDSLQNLAACRGRLLKLDQEIPVSGSMLSCKLEDHADVLGPGSAAVWDSRATAQERSSHDAGFDASSDLDRPRGFDHSSFPDCGAGDAVRGFDVELDNNRLEGELSMAKALLMLNNVQLTMDLSTEDNQAPPQPVHLKGNARLIKALVTLRQKVALLNQQYLLLRGDMLYLSHEMTVCKQWVNQSFGMALQSQCQDVSSLQTRFERLSKVLN